MTCEVTVDVDDGLGRRVFHCGDVVRGTAHIKPIIDLTAHGVVVSAIWKLTGENLFESGIAAEITLPGGEWPADALVQRAFELALPHVVPWTQAGALATIEWSVTARVQMAWRSEPVGATRIEVLPGPRTTPYRADLVGRHVGTLLARRNESQIPVGCFGCAAFPLVATGLVMLFADAPPMLGLLGAALAFLPTSSVVGLWLWRRTTIAPTVVLGLFPARVSAGTTFDARIELERINADGLKSLMFELVGEERVMNIEDNWQRRYVRHRSVHTASHEVIDDRIRYSARIQVPETASSSLSVGRYQIVWRVIARATFERQADRTWEEEVEVDVERPSL